MSLVSQSPNVLRLRDELRVATAELHEEIDKHFQDYDLTNFVGYRTFLEASAEALIPVERGLERADVAQLFPDWPALRRSDAIITDLDKLGGTCELLPEMEIHDVGALLGAMYVLEGSRLGAKTLLRVVSGSSDLRVRQATAYLSHGERQPLWPKFLQELQRHADGLTETNSAIASARHVFRLFGQAAARHAPMNCGG